jgi:hypothetical protein
LSSGLIGGVTSGNNVSFEMFAADSSVSYVFNSVNFTGNQPPILTVTAVAVPETDYAGILIASVLVIATWAPGLRRTPLR